MPKVRGKEEALGCIWGQRRARVMLREGGRVLGSAQLQRACTIRTDAAALRGWRCCPARLAAAVQYGPAADRLCIPYPVSKTVLYNVCLCTAWRPMAKAGYASVELVTLEVPAGSFSARSLTLNVTWR